MTTKHLTVGRTVRVRFGSEWRPGTVTRNTGLDVQVLVGSDTISIHRDVIRRDLRVGRGK